MSADKYPSPQPNLVAQDVINLVIAAREAFDTATLPDDENQALDKALEAFASRVPYENEPDDAATATAAPLPPSKVREE